MQREERLDPEVATVRVVDDDESFRRSIIRLLEASGFAARGYGCAGEFLLSDAINHPGCILLDIAMPGPSGIDVLKALRARRSVLPIIFVTGRDDVLTSVDVMKAGAVDYIVKPARAEKILSAVTQALERNARDRLVQAEMTELHSRFAQLTSLERSIFHGIADSKLNKQLAAELGTCERTIKAQRARMLRKMRIRSVPELIRAAKLLEEHAAQEDAWKREMSALSPPSYSFAPVIEDDMLYQGLSGLGPAVLAESGEGPRGGQGPRVVPCQTQGG